MTTTTDAKVCGTHLIDAVTVADLDALRTLNPDQLQRQQEARGELVRYLTSVWEDSKGRGEDPANNPLYLGIGSARDLLIAMHGYAEAPHEYAAELGIDTTEGRAALALDDEDGSEVRADPRCSRDRQYADDAVGDEHWDSDD